MVGFIMDMIRNRHFTVHIGSKKSRRRTLKNGVPQGVVECLNVIFETNNQPYPPMYVRSTYMLMTLR